MRTPRRHALARSAATFITLAALTITGGITAHAADPAPADANAAAAAIEDVAPEVEAVEFVERADKAKASIDAGTVTTSDSAVSLDVKGTPAGLTIDLPVPADAELVVANDGTAVYASESPVDVAVQAHENGVRVQTVLDSKAAPERFAYTPGANDTIVQNPDGSVIIYSLDPATDAILVTEVAAAWAYDANGTPVPTRYELGRDGLVQVVEHKSGDFAYPIVADPTYITGTNWFFGGPFVEAQFNKSETKRVAAGAGVVTAIGTMIGKIPTPPTVVASTVLAVIGGSVTVWAGSAVAANACIALRWYYQTPQLPIPGTIVTTWGRFAPLYLSSGVGNCR